MENNINVLPKGTVLHNGKRKYKVEKVLGTGGFGITYKVSSTVMVDNVAINTFFAMKEYFLSSCYRGDDGATMLFSPTMKIEVEESLNDFITEAKRLNSLGHKSDNIVKVNEVFKENDTAYYIMEYLEGGNLQEYVRKKGLLNEAEAITLITPIAHAVEALHSERILHLDIKPENIVLKKDRDTGKTIPVLIDFGLVKHFDSKGKPTTRLAAKGASDGFAPMEQYTTIDNFAPTLDVYALGATLYYLLKGKNPPKAFDIESTASIRESLPSSISEKTKNAIVGAMEKSKFERTQSVGLFLSALCDNESVIVTGEPVKPTKTTKFASKDSKKHYIKKLIGFWIAAIVCVLLFIVGETGAYFYFQQPKQITPPSVIEREKQELIPRQEAPIPRSKEAPKETIVVKETIVKQEKDVVHKKSNKGSKSVEDMIKGKSEKDKSKSDNDIIVDKIKTENNQKEKNLE